MTQIPTFIGNKSKTICPMFCDISECKNKTESNLCEKYMCMDNIESFCEKIAENFYAKTKIDLKNQCIKIC